MGHWLPGQAIVQPFNGVASCGDLLVIKPWINVLQMGSLLMNRKGFESWETLNAGTIKACNVCLHFNIIVCLSTSRLPGPQLVDNNQLQRQVCPAGCVLSWKKWVYFVNYSSWLLPVQWLPHCMFLEGGAGPIWEFQGHGCLGVTFTFHTRPGLGHSSQGVMTLRLLQCSQLWYY